MARFPSTVIRCASLDNKPRGEEKNSRVSRRTLKDPLSWCRGEQERSIPDGGAGKVQASPRGVIECNGRAHRLSW